MMGIRGQPGQILHRSQKCSPKGTPIQVLWGQRRRASNTGLRINASQPGLGESVPTLLCDTGLKDGSEEFLPTFQKKLSWEKGTCPRVSLQPGTCGRLPLSVLGCPGAGGGGPATGCPVLLGQKRAAAVPLFLRHPHSALSLQMSPFFLGISFLLNWK